jgi:hypothetical protein
MQRTSRARKCGRAVAGDGRRGGGSQSSQWARGPLVVRGVVVVMFGVSGLAAAAERRGYSNRYWRRLCGARATVRSLQRRMRRALMVLSCPKRSRSAMVIAYTILCNRCQYSVPPLSLLSSPGGLGVERCDVNDVFCCLGACPAGCLHTDANC